MTPGKTAILILNRNLPGPTDSLCESFLYFEKSGQFDIFVIEAGSDIEKLSKFATWHVNTQEVMNHGMRTCRGFNFGLKKLYDGGKFFNYDYFLTVTNDSVFDKKAILPILIEEIEKHQKVGILSPCSRRWGEKNLLNVMNTRYFWYVHNTAYFLRRQFIESVLNSKDELKFFFDGANFRGYGSDIEVIAKGYANDWATAITSRVFVEENESYLIEKSDYIKTEAYEENLLLCVKEGREWMKKKYGFTSRWQMQKYVQFWYDSFFDFHPELALFKI